MSTPLVIVVLLVSVLIGLSKGGLGAALVVLTTPLLSLVMPAQQAVSISLPLLLIADVFALWMYWKKWDMHYIRLMMPTGVVGVLLGTYLLASLSDNTLRQLIALFALVFIAYRLLDRQLKNLNYQPRNWHGWVAGAASGLASALANNGAPPFTAYMLLQKVSPVTFIGTTTLFFATMNVLKVPTFVQTGLLDFQDVLNVIWAVPGIVVGVLAGRWLVKRLNPVMFEYIMLAVLLVAAVGLLFIIPSR